MSPGFQPGGGIAVSSGGVNVFDEQHLVALLVVNEIVDLLFRQQ
jgi:hypothetical protein